MKRELKEAIEERARFIYCDIARPIPMKRELKVCGMCSAPKDEILIARPIPMKRELKEDGALRGLQGDRHRKAHPDEKGTES